MGFLFQVLGPFAQRPQQQPIFLCHAETLRIQPSFHVSQVPVITHVCI